MCSSRSNFSVEARRTMPWTSYPFASSRSARYDPSCPVIPVTKARRSLTMLTLRQCGARPFPRHLAREGGQEAGVVVQVARQEPARLLHDPVGPLEPALLHPARRL